MMGKRRYRYESRVDESKPHVGVGLLGQINDPKWGDRLDKLTSLANMANNFVHIWEHAYKGPLYLKIFATVSTLGLIRDTLTVDTSAVAYLIKRGFACHGVSPSLVYPTFAEGEKKRVVRLGMQAFDVYALNGDREVEVGFLMEGDTVLSGPWFHKDCAEEEILSRIGEHVWSQHNGGHILLTVSREDGDETLDIERLEEHVGDFVGPNNETDLLHAWEQYRERGLGRTLLLYGPPGTGKSTVAIRAAKARGGRVVKMDSSFLSNTYARTVALTLRMLKPEVLLLDDIDRHEDEGKLLSYLEELNKTQRDFLVIATANKLARMDPATVRPGRIDRIIQYDLPDREHRAKIIDHYLHIWKCPGLKEEGWEVGLLDCTEGLSPAHILELIRDASITGEGLKSVQERAKEMVEQLEEMNYLMDDREYRRMNVRNSGMHPKRMRQ